MTREQIVAAGITYVGRSNPRRRLYGHVLANPFKHPRDGTVAECVEKFRQYLLAHPALVMEAKRLKGQTLGCWCDQSEGNPCHAKVIAEIADAGDVAFPDEATKQQMRSERIRDRLMKFYQRGR